MSSSPPAGLWTDDETWAHSCESSEWHLVKTARKTARLNCRDYAPDRYCTLQSGVCNPQFRVVPTWPRRVDRSPAASPPRDLFSTGPPARARGALTPGCRACTLARCRCPAPRCRRFAVGYSWVPIIEAPTCTVALAHSPTCRVHSSRPWPVLCAGGVPGCYMSSSLELAPPHRLCVHLCVCSTIHCADGSCCQPWRTDSSQYRKD